MPRVLIVNRMCKTNAHADRFMVSSDRVMEKQGHTVTQVKLIDFLSLTSEANTQPSNRNKGANASPPVTKKAKHQERRFNSAWKDEFMWIHMVEDQEGPGMVCCKHNQTTKKMVWIQILL